LRDGLDDSKKLNRAAREEYAALLRRSGIISASARRAPPRSTAATILQATLLAMCRAVSALGIAPSIALVDGNVPPPAALPGRDGDGGDGLSLFDRGGVDHRQGDARPPDAAAGLAGTPAMAGRPMSGYGTEQHRTALRALGPTPHHRRSFAPLQLAFEFRLQRNAISH